ncbi:MAG: xanthine dehydrogenase family protein molybdopterin-binding subunit [Acidobacteria bacterium]|nr:xanthine dehydrogenase family protein molybdopterin-binding subunit [Acidobacteriota bacterium]
MSTAMRPEALSALAGEGLSRRNFFRSAGALIVGFSMSGALENAEAQTATGFPAPTIATNQVDSWIAIASDDSVTAYTGKCDFGQGFRTVQHQLVAEELGVPLARVKMIICDTAQCPDQGVSSGSQGHPTQFGNGALRTALATAREALFKMASDQLGVAVDELDVENGIVFVKSDRGKGMSYGRLIGGKKISLALDARAATKNPANYKILGTSVPRYDVPPKATGEFEYVHNIRLPAMIHARVVRPPRVGAKLVSVDESSVKSLPGNVKVVARKDFVAVAADTQWEAMQAADTLVVKWSGGDKLPDQDTIFGTMRKLPSRDAYAVVANDVDAKLKSAAQTFKATYFHPFQMHGSLGTSCAVADVRGTGANTTATVWSASQGIYPQRDSLALILGTAKENVRCIFVEGSGCYGLNGADSVAYDAAVVSQATGRAVRVQYSRKDEMTAGESYGPAYVIDLKAGVDDKGQIIAWDYEGWTFSKGNRPNATTPGNVIAGALLGFPVPANTPTTTPSVPNSFSNNANVASAYGTGCVGGSCGGTGTVQSERILTHTIASPFFTGPLRSPNRLQNTFANESFIDEIAAALKVDSVAYRLRHLTDSRLIDVMNGAARAAKWDTRPSPNPRNAKTGVVTGRGIAIVFYEGNNGYGGLVAEVSVDQASGYVTVTRIVASNDSGPISNPDGLRAQMEGGALQGMSRALFEEVKWNEESVTSTDWRRFPVYKFGDVLPVVETVLIDRRDKQQMGAGETIITVVAAAIANAIFDAAGARVRQVPFTPDRVLAALAARE